ncbi:MAG: extracellular solute-binding protein [Kouleothrix sp.]|nr:extracellular solute-binding protein [Kouleothrix sp.]
MLPKAHLRALLLIFLLAGCQSAPARPTPAPVGPTSVPTAAPRLTAVPPVTAVSAPTPPPSALVLWAIAEGPELAALRALLADLGQTLGVEVAVVGKSADGMLADIRADALSSVRPPDLLWGTQEELASLQAAGLLQPPDDRLDDAAFLPAVIAGATLEGRRWGTPVAAQGALLLLYNRGSVDRPPRTTDELIASARRLTGGDRYGLVAGWAEPRWFSAWLAGFGATPISPDGAPTLDTPQTVAALNLVRELRSSGPPPPSTYQDGVRLFRRGRAAFAIDGDWSLEGYRAYSDTLDLGIAPLPVVDATGLAAAAPLDGIYLMYSRALDGERLSQARALGAALAQPAAQARIARELQRLPALRAALADPAVTGDPALAAAAASAERAAALPPIQGLRCAWGAIRAELPPVLMGEQTQADAAAAMQADALACQR